MVTKKKSARQGMATSKRSASKKATSSKNSASKNSASNKTASRTAKPSLTKPSSTPAPIATDAEREALRASMIDFASNNYPIVDLRFPACACGGDRFLLGGEDGTCAIRQCDACKREHPIADSAEYWDEADTEQCFCTCEHGVFQVGVGFAITKDQKDLRWIYVGGRCVHCGLAGVYLDWKIDYGPSLHLVDQA